MTRAALLASLINSSNTLTAVDFTDTGNTVFGDASVDTLTINGTNVSIPNNLNIGANTFFINSSNNRVGINTALPLYDLDVTGNVNVSKTLWTPSGIIGQSYDQGTGVLQVTGQSTFNGVVTDKSLNLQGGNNLLTQSQTLATSPWTFSSGGTGVTSVTQNATTAPDNTTTSNLLLASNTSAGHFIYSTVILTSGITYTYSVYAKAGTNNFLQLNFGGDVAFANFNLSTGVSGTYASCTPSIQSVGNGWYRCIVGAVTPTANRNPEINIANSASMTVNASWSAAGTETIYVWGAQLELGSVASNYTPTTTTAVTTTNNISVPSGQVLANYSGSLSLPAYSFLGNANTGFTFAGANAYYGVLGGVASFGYFTDKLEIASGMSYAFSSSASAGSTPDLLLSRDAANTLAQRNSTNAQTFRLYNTYTDSSNYEALSITWAGTYSNRLAINAIKAGTGTLRAIDIGGSSVNFWPNGVGNAAGRWDLGTNGTLNPDNDAVSDLGATSQRIKNAYFSGVVTTNSDASINGVTVGLGGGAVGSNTAVGQNALVSTNTQGYNTAIGSASQQLSTSGKFNVSIGYATLSNNISGTANIAMGQGASQYGAAISNTVAIGNSALQWNQNSGSLAVGANALSVNTTSPSLTAIGTNALQSNTTNVATLGTITGGTGYTNGTYTGVVMTLSSGSTAVTYPTATIVVSGGAVTSVTLTSNGVGFKDTTTVLTAPAASIGGTGSGFTVPVATLASGTLNVAVGYQAGYSNSTGNSLTFAGYSNSTGTYNTFYGMQSGYGTTTGLNNTSSGYLSLFTNSTSSGNSAFGSQSLQLNTGANNSAYGATALYNNSTGARNLAFGVQAGTGNSSANANTTGSNNTYLGYQTVGSANNNTNEMVIGYQAVGLGSNTTVIGNSSTTLTQTYGVTKSTNYTVATLPSASTSGVGARAFVTDALAPSFGVAVTGGGAVPVPVYVGASNTWYVG